MTKVKAETTSGLRSVVAAFKERPDIIDKAAPCESPVAQTIDETPRRGRRAKARKEVVQVTAYIDKATHLSVKRKLLDLEAEWGRKQDFSSLVQRLLDQWLGTKAADQEETQR